LLNDEEFNLLKETLLELNDKEEPLSKDIKSTVSKT
jgi:hypothetical protein